MVMKLIGVYLGFVCIFENVEFILFLEIDFYKFRVFIIIRLCRDK